MGKKKNNKKGFNKLEDALNNLNGKGGNNGKIEISGTTNIPEMQTSSEPTVTNTDQTVNDEVEAAVENKEDVKAVYDDGFDIESITLSDELRKLKELGQKISHELATDNTVSRGAKARAMAYSDDRLLFAPRDTSELAKMAVSNLMLPKTIKYYEDIIDNTKNVDAKQKAIRELRKVKQEYAISQLKDAIETEKFKLSKLMMEQNAENERKDEAKAKLDELRIKYGDELIKSLIA